MIYRTETQFIATGFVLTCSTTFVGVIKIKFCLKTWSGAWYLVKNERYKSVPCIVCPLGTKQILSEAFCDTIHNKVGISGDNIMCTWSFRCNVVMVYLLLILCRRSLEGKKIKITIFYVRPRTLVNRYQRFGRSCCLHFQGRKELIFTMGLE